MLDKSLPYYDILMKADYSLATSHPICGLPCGYRYKFYEEGDAQLWAALETSVNEFVSTSDALMYFNQIFVPHTKELKKRMCFIIDDKQNAVATATAWFRKLDDVCVPLLHWVSVHPDMQGFGLGKAITIYALHQFLTLSDSKPIYLHTQTWSATAVAMYGKLGFKVSNEVFFQLSTRKEAKAVLERVLSKEVIDCVYKDFE